METSIKAVKRDGLTICLLDGSVWTPENVGDLTRTILWYPTQRITVAKDDNGYTLTNLDTSTCDRIRVSRVR